ncbi:MAG: HNH endonuclease [Elusimicrobia bacterium]|nr:HNH endonuclease [Elusimicrobiota bacterium]
MVNEKGLWERRRLAILSAIAKKNHATRKELLTSFIQGDKSLLQKGPKEPDQKGPEYYFEQSRRRILQDGLVILVEGRHALTEKGRSKLSGISSIHPTTTAKGAIRLLSSRDAVLQAIAECRRLGVEKFLEKYGFGPATTYHLFFEGSYFDSKAIVGVAYGIEHGRPLGAGDFSGGLQTVVPKLKELGFQVVADKVKETLALPEEAEASEFWEGSRQNVIVNRYERNADAREACIQHYGTSCFVCNFDFAVAYGDQFMGFIHVHHIVPLAAKKSSYKVNPKTDLRPVCPNCHAVIHYGGKTRTIDEAQKLVAAQRDVAEVGEQ